MACLCRSFAHSQHANDRDDSVHVDSVALTDTETRKEGNFLKKGTYPGLLTDQPVRTVPGTVVKKMQDDGDFWYANAELEKEKLREYQSRNRIPLVRQTWFQTFLWLIIIAGFAAVIIWWLGESNVSVFRRRNTIIASEEGEAPTEDIFTINYQKEIDKAIREGDYRVAVRMMFLRLLKDLSEKNIIDYQPGRTNFDYFIQLQPTRYYRDFFRIARNYEYSWYGHFDVDENAFHSIQQEFHQFNRQLKWY